MDSASGVQVKSMLSVRYGPYADAHERQLTGCLNFINENARNLTGVSDSNLPNKVDNVWW